MKFIAAMDHSGGSTGSVLERYEQEYTEENKMDLVHQMRLRMINSPLFNSEYIWAAILYTDTIERGITELLRDKGIESYVKIDSGCEADGTLKAFNVEAMIEFAHENDCTGTKMRSIVKTTDSIDPILKQQFEIAQTIVNNGLTPIVEPEVPIDLKEKRDIEIQLRHAMEDYLDNFNGQVILKLTIPDEANLYQALSQHKNVKKLVGLSGGYTTSEAVSKLSQQLDMSASFSRALSEGLFAHQHPSEFDKKISTNIKRIEGASS